MKKLVLFLSVALSLCDTPQLVYNKNRDGILALYQLMKDAHELFVREKLTYWIDWGTLLGAVRHQGIIPWDDDLDVCIASCDIDHFLSLRRQFEKLGYQIKKESFGYSIWRAQEACLDIFITHTKKKKIIDKTDARYLYTQKQLFPLKLYRFGSIDVYGPHESHAHLSGLYGKDYMDIAYRQFDHSATMDPVPIPLTEQDRLPAQPIGPLRDRVKGIVACH